MAFPNPGAEIYYNEAGEPTGWDASSDYSGESYYCDICGFSHSGDCPDDSYDEDDSDYEWCEDCGCSHNPSKHYE